MIGTLAQYYLTPRDPTPADARLVGIARHLAEIAIERDAAQSGLQAARDELERRVEQRTRLLAESQSLAHMGSFEWDVTTDQVRWSEELYRIYGLDPGSFGATLEAFLGQIHPDDRDRVASVIAESVASGRPYRLEERVVRPNGEEVVLSSIGRVELESGRAARVWGVCLDVTEQKRAEQIALELTAGLERRVAERTMQLEAANRELEAFSYSVSHDLRAPLRAIDGFSQILLEDYEHRLDATAVDYLRRVRTASQRMAELIDAMLHLSRVTRGHIACGRVDISELARRSADEQLAAVPRRQIELTIAPGLEAWADARLIRAALDNLLSNAIKFTGRHPTAHIEVGQAQVDGEQAFFVRDDGVGFEMEHAAKLFEPFYRMRGHEGFEGTGIGLATVQRIVHRHGGRIWADSAPGRGATFWFTLPEAR